MTWNERLRALFQESGMSMAELSRKAGVGYDSLNKYLRGEVDQPRGNTLGKLATALGTSVIYLRDGLTDPQPLSTRAIPYRGFVAAGSWWEAGEALSEPDEWLGFNPVPQYPDGAVYCLRVQGDSIDRVAPHGSTVVCVDLITTGIAIADGDLVVVERSRDDGGLLETTAKRVHVVPGGYELRPESSNKRWKPLFVPRNGTADNGETVRIIAKIEYVMHRP